MSQIIRFSVSDEQYTELLEKAQNNGQGLQGYLRNLLFGGDDIYTPAVAFKRALAPSFKQSVQCKRVKVFELRDLYSDDEWKLLSIGEAGAFGKAFYEWVQSHSDEITYYDGGSKGKRARYRYV